MADNTEQLLDAIRGHQAEIDRDIETIAEINPDVAEVLSDIRRRQHLLIRFVEAAARMETNEAAEPPIEE